MLKRLSSIFVTIYGEPPPTGELAIVYRRIAAASLAINIAGIFQVGSLDRRDFYLWFAALMFATGIPLSGAGALLMEFAVCRKCRMSDFANIVSALGVGFCAGGLVCWIHHIDANIGNGFGLAALAVAIPIISELWKLQFGDSAAERKQESAKGGDVQPAARRSSDAAGVM